MKKYEVHWVNHRTNEDSTHGQYDTLAEAIESVNAWWDLHDFSPSYVRQWTIDGETTLDYGYHHMFYIIKELDVSEEPKLSLTEVIHEMTEKPEILFTKDTGATVPSRGRKQDIAHDMYTNDSAFLIADRIGATIIPSGIRTAFDASKYGLFISPRSGITKYPMELANNTGLIEGEYRGDVGFPMRNTAHFGFCPQSNRILSINDKGKLISVDVDDFFASKPKEEYDKYLAELDKLVEEFTLVWNSEMANNFGEAMKIPDLAGHMVVPSGTLYVPKGLRIAQAYLIDRKDPVWKEVQELPESYRGENGYGSSGAF